MNLNKISILKENDKKKTSITTEYLVLGYRKAMRFLLSNKEKKSANPQFYLDGRSCHIPHNFHFPNMFRASLTSSSFFTLGYLARRLQPSTCPWNRAIPWAECFTSSAGHLPTFSACFHTNTSPAGGLYRFSSGVCQLKEEGEKTTGSFSVEICKAKQKTLIFFAGHSMYTMII